MQNWKKVLATHEEPQDLSRTKWLGDNFPGVALPSGNAYGKFVEIRYHDKWTIAQVVDHGPWCEDNDDEYVFGDARPRSESAKADFDSNLNKPGIQKATVEGKPIKESNGAGIDLFPRVARQLGIPIDINVQLEWRFLEPNA